MSADLRALEAAIARFAPDETFTADDVRLELGPQGAQIPDNARGALFKAALHHNLIRKVGYAPSRMKVRRGGVQAVYRRCLN